MTTPIEPDASPSGGSALERLRYEKRFVEVDVPLGVRAIQALDIAIAVAFATPLMRLLIDLAAMALLVITVTSQAGGVTDQTPVQKLDPGAGSNAARGVHLLA